MRLSEAMMLGAATCKMEAYDIDTCALGSALNAVGVPQRSWDPLDSIFRYRQVESRWPWVYSSPVGLTQIVDLFDRKVCSGEMTFEQLVDYVRSIEPDCGNCNRFDCTCTKTKAETTEDCLQAQ
jgi:hypothetical protein